MSNKIVIAGIQPTNKLTLGNYLGSLLPTVKLQQKYNCIFFVADLHSLTTLILTDKISLLQKKDELIRWSLAAGMDENKTIIFYQSDIPAHLELFYYLMLHTNTGELSRMTQYKDILGKLKQKNNTYISPTSILLYPVLMAADVLLYDADFIAVGQDQKQHIELCNNIAERLNKKYNQNIFNLPKALITENGGKIRDLQNPLKKMSKSYTDELGTIFLTDTVEEVKNKIFKAKTDDLHQINYDWEKQPGITNLIQIFCALENQSIKDFLKSNQTLSYKKLKELIADTINKHLTKLQEKFYSFSDEHIQNILQIGSKKAYSISQNKIKIIKRLFFDFI